jgi:S-adenosylmethionine:tRNA ribosyltransferase-isomerase
LGFPQGVEGEVRRSDGEGGGWVLRFRGLQGDLPTYLEANGRTPLPPYIRRPPPDGGSSLESVDRDRYQTVFARWSGSVAAPTAGLHFTLGLRRELEEAGVEFAEVTLHVGPGTFLPIRCQDIRDHRIRPEWYRVSEEAARRIRRAKREGKRVVAVGTTAVRCLESLAWGATRGDLEAAEGWTDLYILPGHRFRIVDAMVTNLHLPGSSLLVLVSAFAGRGLILDAYREAVRQGYRFYSYGDCMLIE